MPAWPGLSWLLMVLIGTVTYDGVSGTEWWIGLAGSRRDEPWLETLAMLGWVGVIAVAYFLACRYSAAVAGGSRSSALIADRFAHTLVPIALAYALAHYLTLILFEGQIFIAAVSDPFGMGWDLFGTADRTVSFWLSPEVVWYLQVLIIVAGHVAGVVLAHDRALATSARRRRCAPNMPCWC